MSPLLADFSLSAAALTALVSAAVAGAISLATNLLLGAPMEVRKRRALRRDDTLAEIEESVRLQLNAVRLLPQRGALSWTTQDDRIAKFTDDFDDTADKIGEYYQAALRHFAGTDGREPEQTIGLAVLVAGTHVSSVKRFREGAVGEDPEGLQILGTSMANDLATAQELLQSAVKCVSTGPLRRRVDRRSLQSRLRSLQARMAAGEAPETTLSYKVALERAKELTRGGLGQSGVDRVARERR